MNPLIRRIEELRTAAQVRDVDLSGIHVHEPESWIVAAAGLLGYDPALALAVDLSIEFVIENS